MRKVDPEKHEAKRQQILQAAVACFARKGFHRTSTAEICAEAGMSPGNLFYYFPNKQAIIAAIVEEERRQTADYFEGTIQSADLFAELLDFMDIVLELASDPTYLKLALEIAAEAMRDEEIGKLVTKNDNELQVALNTLLRNAAARGQVDPTLDPADSARWIAALIDGVFSRVAIDPGFNPLEQRPMLRLLITRFLRPGAVPTG
ncbi:MAG: TetR/AcrR family transcriptional regulator [Aquamicrobium sp.]|jgi:TetR/AcrR family transcriptional repressor of uid operon|uniref:TetR/AcrR family transcriptional regulator n=1 Tax=Mesorhizobium TaxID=68287 RepID=UPI001011DCAA|nr:MULTISPECIES: TetR/AcrR family transcriptional regulator [Mesorhizobium]MBR2688461.1 TetR/AcrR family transcriptional regulator [Aquamicrobium sp.]QAZ45478.1 TetR family transcriptional regulator [Mesorhizobium sp. Pch-S]